MILPFHPLLNAVSSDDRVESARAAPLAEVVRPGALSRTAAVIKVLNSMLFVALAASMNMPCFR